MEEMMLAPHSTHVPSLPIKKIANVKTPSYAHEGDAGLDLYARETVILAPMGTGIVPTGIQIAIPEGHVGLVWDKSGLAAQSLHTVAGVIDSSYRGEIQVVIKNLNTKPVSIPQHSKIAQLLIQPIARVAVREVEELPDTTRGAAGFGSTGID